MFKVSLAVTLRLSGVAVNQTCTLGGVDVYTRLFVDHHCVNVFIRKFSLPTVGMFGL